MNMVYQLLRHIDEKVTREISKHLGWTIVQSPFQPCAACARAKIKRKAVMEGKIIRWGCRKQAGESLLTSAVPRQRDPDQHIRIG